MPKCLLLIVVLSSSSIKLKAKTPKTPSNPDLHIGLFRLPPGILLSHRASVQDKWVEMLSVTLKIIVRGPRPGMVYYVLYFAPEEITSTCLWNSSSSVILLIQRSQNAIERELEHRAKAIYLRKCQEEIQSELGKCLLFKNI